MPPPDALTSLPAYPAFEFESRVQELPPLTGDPRADFLAGRRFVEDVHRAGGSGHTVVRLQSAAMDRMVVALWERAASQAAARRGRSPVALVALGGYGRRELAPFSDLDLLVLHRPGEPDAFTREASEKFLYSLWDLKLEVGQGVRDVAECGRLAEQDLSARTALLDLRLLAGDAGLYRELERDQLHGLSQAKVDAFIADKIAETRARRERFGDSLYLLEPNVKQSEGGLRDLQSALWLARVRFKVAGITELLSRALLPEREIREMRRARDFLWRVRNEMHYLAGRKWDQLTFDVQPQVAAAMGYADGEGGSAVEEFMRHYYLAAKTVLVRGGRARVAQTGQNTLMVYPTKKAEEALKKALVKWGRFQVVDDAAKADLILVISEGEVAESRMERLTGHLAIFPGGSTADTDVKPLWEVEEVGPAFGFNRRPTNKLIEHLRGDLAEFEKPAPPAATR